MAGLPRPACAATAPGTLPGRQEWWPAADCGRWPWTARPAAGPAAPTAPGCTCSAPPTTTGASRTGSEPVNLATIRAAIIAAIKDAGYLHIPEGRRDHTTPAETLRLHGLD
jgi:hypothetical protein